MSDPRLKKLRISTGVVKRCGKEKISYRKEADMQKGKIEKMKTEGRDEIEIRKMNEVCRYFPTLENPTPLEIFPPVRNRSRSHP